MASATWVNLRMTSVKEMAHFTGKMVGSMRENGVMVNNTVAVSSKRVIRPREMEFGKMVATLNGMITKSDLMMLSNLYKVLNKEKQGTRCLFLNKSLHK